MSRIPCSMQLKQVAANAKYGELNVGVFLIFLWNSNLEACQSYFSHIDLL
jgi:hypothetical protein